MDFKTHLHAVSFVVLELIRNAVGSAQILMSQKVQQFFRLCQQSVVSMRKGMPNHFISFRIRYGFGTYITNSKILLTHVSNLQ